MRVGLAVLKKSDLLKIPKSQHKLVRDYKRGKLVFYFLNNAAKTCSYCLKISKNFQIKHVFQSKAFFHPSNFLHTNCLSAFKEHIFFINTWASLAKWSSVRLRTRWLWVRVLLQSLGSVLDIPRFTIPKLLCFYYNQYDEVNSHGQTIQKECYRFVFQHLLSQVLHN